MLTRQAYVYFPVSQQNYDTKFSRISCIRKKLIDQPTSPASLMSFFPSSITSFFSQLSENKRTQLGLLLLGILIYLGAAIYAPALLDDADSVHAQAAYEMTQRGGFITLYADGIRYLEKAPLMYWGMGLGYQLFGKSEVAARLPLVFSTVALILMTAHVARWAFGARTGLYSGLVIGTSVGIYLFTRFLIPDVMVGLWLTIGFYCFLRFLDQLDQGQSGKKWLMGLYASSALAVLTKGLIGMVFPGVTIFLFVVVTRRWRLIPALVSVPGLLLFLAIAAPWHIWAGLQNQNGPNGHGFFWFYFVNEHFLRYLGKRYPVDYDKVPLFLFYGLHLVWLFPWTLFSPFLFLKNTPKDIPNSPLGNENKSALTLLLIWPAVIILFFTFSTRQEYYTVPALPALAMLLGRALAKAELTESAQVRRWFSLVSGSLFVVSLFCAVGVGWILYKTIGIQVDGDISSVLTTNPEYYALSLGHFFDLTLESCAVLRGPLAAAGGVFLVGSSFVYWFDRRKNHLGAHLALALTMAGFFACSQAAMKIFEPHLSSIELAKVITASTKSGEPTIIINGEYESGSSINFYTNLPVMMLNGRTANLEFGSKFPDAPKRFLETSELATYWGGPGKVYLVTEEKKLKEVQSAIVTSPMFEIKRSGGKVLLSNQPR